MFVRRRVTGTAGPAYGELGSAVPGPGPGTSSSVISAVEPLDVHLDPEVVSRAAERRPAHDLAELSGGARLAGLRAAGLVRRASERADTRVEALLPVGASLRQLLPGGGLRRGTTVAIASEAGRVGTGRSDVEGESGATSLLLTLIAEASAAGSWCAAVGLPRLGLVAAAEAGVALHRFALVPHPGPDWAAVVAALIDGVDIVIVTTPTGVPASLATRLAARARQRGCVLVPLGRWPGADVTLEVVRASWHGLGSGRGRLRAREVELVVRGRGAAARPRRSLLWLPGAEPLAGVVPLGGVVPLSGPARAGDGDERIRRRAS